MKSRIVDWLNSAANAPECRVGVRLGLVLAGSIALAGCAQTTLVAHTAKQAARVEAPAKQQGTYKVGNPYQIAGVWYYPKEDPNYDETGIASWYGEQFHAKQTANGETYDMNDLTAAHQTLPMPSYVRVTNLENGRSIIVRVNDRGPFANSRIIDMSRRGAQLLGFERQGTARVRIQIVGNATGDPNFVQPRPQTAAEDKPAMSAVPRGAVTAEALPPPPGVRGQATMTVAQTGTPAQSSASVLAASDAATAVDLSQQVVRNVPVKPTGIFVQAGAFTRFDNANRLSAQISSLGKAQVSSAIVNGTEYFRVRIGPLSDVTQADAMLSQLIGNGQSGAKIVVE